MYAYSAVGDMTVFLLCIVMLLLLRATYTQKSRRYKFVIAALLNLMYISTLSIVFNYYIYPNAASASLTLVYLLHNSLYISLIMQLGLYIFYIFDLIGYRRRWCTCTMILLWAVFIVLEMTSAFTGIGFYIEDGVIYDYTHDSLYLIWYILYLGFMAGIILTQNKVIIRKIYTAIILTMGISLFVTI